MSQPAANSRVVRFGLYELDLDTRELRKSGIRIKLPEQPFLVLEMLLDRPGGIVTREELKRKLWPGDTFVDFDLSLNSAVKKLRQALNDDSDNPRYIETLYRRGYRFIGSVNGTNGNVPVLVTSPAPTLTARETAPSEVAFASSKDGPGPARRGRLALYLAVALPALLAVALLSQVPSRPPKVLGYTQITHDGLAKADLLTDGERIYFREFQGDRFVVGQVSVAGGESSLVPMPFENAHPGDVAADGSALLVGAFRGTGKDVELWSVPLPSGAPRRLGETTGVESAVWSHDGKQLYFASGADLFVAHSDGTQPQKLASVAREVVDLHVSPDDKKLRFDIVDERNGSSAIWELSRDGKGLHPLLPAWNTDPRECCGAWTPDGKYFVFQSFRDGRMSLWALPEKSSWWSSRREPIQLTNGPLHFSSPAPSRDGKRIFTVGAQPRGELLQYDGKSFVPYMNGISATDLDFSPDRRWVVYVSVPERQLWKCKVDGSERRPLTSESIFAGLPRWSPDGSQIVFMGRTSKSGWHAYLVSADGGGLREMIPGAEAGYDPSWSADGKSVVLTLNDAGSPSSLAEGPGIGIFNLSTGKLNLLPDAKLLFSPRWSPDGRYIAAITDDSQKLMLFDVAAQQWHELLHQDMGYPSWSHDSQYIYFDTTLTEKAGFYRVRISDHKVERLAGLNGIHRLWLELGSWTALTPDESPLLIRDISSQEIYALELQ